MAGHLARAMGVDECAISYWDRLSGQVESLGYHPPLRLEELEPFFEVAGYPETMRVLERGVTVIIDADDPAADPAESRFCGATGSACSSCCHSSPRPGDRAGRAVIEIIRRWDAQQLEVARTMANEAAMALEGTRL